MDTQLVELDLADWSAATANEAWIAALGEIVAQNLQGWPVQAVPVPHTTGA